MNKENIFNLIPVFIICSMLFGCNQENNINGDVEADNLNNIDSPQDDGTTVNSILIAWDPPTTNIDGSDLTNLAGYILTYDNLSNGETGEIDIPSPNTTSYNLNTLPQGSYNLFIKAYNSNSIESPLSDSLYVEII